MDELEILKLVAEGRIDADDMNDFRNLSEELQQKIADGELEMDEVEDMDEDLKGMIEDGDIDVDDVEDIL